MIGHNLLKSEFPIFKHNESLVYLDSAATTQRPAAVIDAVTSFYSNRNANIHRGIYQLSTEATQDYERTREIVASFLGAENASTIAFTKGTTEGINIVANSFLSKKLNEGDNVIISTLEHHANLIPWQQLCKRKKALLKVINIDNDGNVDYNHMEHLLDDNTRFLAITHISNTIGTMVTLDKVIQSAKQRGIPVLVDAAQSAATYTPNVQQLGCDFLTFSGHKIFGPFGVGVLYTHPDYHQQMTPYNYGGGMITDVKFDESKFRSYPFNLEAGTAAIAEVIGLGEAIKFINKLDKLTINKQLNELAVYCRDALASLSYVNLVGNPNQSAPIISFNLPDIHPHDVATFLAEDNIAVRAGHHCTQPLLDKMGVNGTVRISLSVYNEKEDIDKLLKSIANIKSHWA